MPNHVLPTKKEAVVWHYLLTAMFFIDPNPPKHRDMIVVIDNFISMELNTFY